MMPVNGKKAARKPWLANLGLLSLSIGVPLLLADFSLKQLKLPKNKDRVMLLAGSSLQSGPHGYRRYQANANVEQAAVYGHKLGYRYAYRTNNLGLVSQPDLGTTEPIDLAIVGDSYAEGQGGYPWILELQANPLAAHQQQSINYAIAGSGVGDFRAAALHAKTMHQARKLLVLMIEHDAYRPYQPMAANRQCSFYSNGWLDQMLGTLSCRLYGIVWHHTPAGLSNQQLIEHAQQFQSFGLIPAITELANQAQRLSKRAESQAPPKEQVPPHNGDPKGQVPLRFGVIPEASIQALKQLERTYGSGKLMIVLLPDGPQQQQARDQTFALALTAAGVSPIVNLKPSCPLASSDFHQIDSHPNRRGYTKILSCLRQNSKVRDFLISAGGNPQTVHAVNQSSNSTINQGMN